MALLRRLIAAIRISPEERQAECAERCLELLCDPERASAARLGEHEEAAIEAVAAPLGAAPPVSPHVAQSSRTSGTKRTSSSSSRSSPAGVRRVSDRRCSGSVTGATRRPPGASWASSSASPSMLPAAATLMASNGRALGQPARAVAHDQRHVLHARGGEVARRAARQARVALDRPHVPRQVREHGGVVARAGADVEHAVLRRGASSSLIRATTSGWEMVCPQPIASARFS